MSINKIEYLQSKKMKLKTSFVVKMIYHYVILGDKKQLKEVMESK